MGQKVNPIGFRVNIEDNKADSTWYASGNDYAAYVLEDFEVRKHIKKVLSQAAVGKIQIERLAKKIIITIHTAKPGVVIGKKGSDIAELKKYLTNLTKCEVHLNIAEIRKPEICASIVAESVATQLEKRVSFRRAMKKVIQSAMRLGAKGIKISCAGRLGGAEIARTEWYREGRVPLHTLRAEIDYAIARANTTYGVIGIKVWIFKGEFIKKEVIEASKL